MSDHSTDKPAETDEEIFLEAAARLKIAAEAESENRVEGILALAFEDGEQWDADIGNQRKIDGRPALTINHTSTVVSRQINTLRQQRPRIKCHPVGNGADVDTASVVNGLIRHIETLSNASVAYDTGVTSAVKIGWGYWRIVSQFLYELGDKNAGYNDQELMIAPIRNTFTVYMDPTAQMPAGEDQMWCLISEKMKRQEYKRRDPRAENCEWEADGPGDMTLDWESKEELRLAEYFRIHEVKDTLCLMSDGSNMLKSEMPDAAVLNAVNLKQAVDARGKPIERYTTRREVQWFRLNGRKVVDRKVLPGKYIPVIRCEGNVLDVNGRVRRKGMIKNLMDPARMTNYWRTAETERYALAPKAPWVAYEGVIEGHPEWQNANQKAYSTLIAKAATGPNGELLPLPQRTPPAPVEAGMTEAAAGAYQDFMSVAGMAQESPEISARIVSGNKYLQRRQGMQDLTHFQYYDNQTLAIMWTGIILLDLIPHYYDTQRMQRIIGDDGLPQLVTINEKKPSEADPAVEEVKNNLQVGRYDVVMDTGPGYQTKREESSAMLMELLGTPLGAKIVETRPDLAIRNMDFEGAQELADALVATTPEGMKQVVEGLPKQAQTIVATLKQQIQQRDQVIQQQALEIKYKATIEAARIDKDRENNVRDNSVKQFGIETQASTARDVAEIRAAAQLLNSKAESDEEEGDAQRLINKGLDS